MNHLNTDAVRNQAHAAGFASVELYIATLLKQDAQRLAESQPTPAVNHKEWMKELKAWSADHPKTTHFVDDSRESIYEGRGL